MKALQHARTLALALLLALTAGCASTGKTPIGALHYKNPARTAETDKKLLIFLRGAGGGNSVFERHGLVDEVIARGLPFDMVAPDAHFGSYSSETLGRRLYEDIIIPARQQGYTEIWVAGVSMGGLGALFLQIEHPDAVDGIILLSPFLGWNGIVKEIRQAGGLPQWEPGPHTVEDWQRYLWSWIKQHREPPARNAPIYLGYGASDIFSNAQSLMASAIPAERTTVIEGGHTYATLRRLWREYLDKYDQELRKQAPLLQHPPATEADLQDKPGMDG